jgi:hypothetical protein
MVAEGSRSYVYERPYLYPKQLGAIFCEERVGVIEATVKSGKTAGCMAWLMEQAVLIGGPGKSFWWLAPVTNQAKIAYRRTKSGLPQGLFQSNDTNMEITIPNGSILRYLGSDDPDNLYGEDVYAAVVDEGSRVKEEAWHALRTTLTATRAPVRIIGNVKGRKNWFWRLCRRAEQGLENHHYARLTADDAVDAGVFSKEDLEEAREAFHGRMDIFRELYYAEASDDQGNPFGYEHIRACTVPELSSGEPRVWGWDLAKSEDWTVGIALDSDWRVCRFERFQKPWSETIQTIRRLRGITPALLDSTGVGDPIVEQVQRGSSGAEGFKFSSQSKQRLMEGLSAAIQGQRVSFPDGPIARELDSFEYHHLSQGRIRYEAARGMLDDCVDALALAVRMAEVRRIRPGIPTYKGGLGMAVTPVPMAW